MGTTRVLREMKTSTYSVLTLVFPLILVLFPSCEGKPISEKDLVGNYDLDSPHLAGSLELKEDHTFVQKFVLPSGKTETANGKWNYLPPLKGQVRRGTVGIYGAMTERKGTLEQTAADFGITMPVSIGWKGIFLSLNPAGDHGYLKRK
jgi:hypothetical protein